MHALRLLLAEIAFRPINFLLCLLAVAVATTLFVAGPLLLGGYMEETRQQLGVFESETEQQLGEFSDVTREQLDAMQVETDKTLAELDKKTKRIMRDIGVNLRIVHKETNFGDLFTDYKAVDFDEDDVHVLAKTPGINAIVHLVATLNEKTMWNDRVVLMVGMLPVLTTSQKNEEKPHMVREVKRGTVHVGHLLGNGVKEGDSLEIKGRTFQVASVEPAKGTQEDVQLVMHLHDAQELLDKQGRIHQILALSCKCEGNRLSIVQQQLETALPHAKVTEMEARASAREKERDLVATKRAEQLATVTQNRERQLSLVKDSRDGQLALVTANRLKTEDSLRQLVTVGTPLMVGVCGLFVGLLTWLNVRERRNEIGVLRALGRGAGGIAGMILGKAALIGLLGGIVGCLVGVLGSQQFTSAAVAPSLIGVAVAGAPVIAVVASYLPMLSALMQDPARVLSDG